jgi:hypothetical protein
MLTDSAVTVEATVVAVAEATLPTDELAFLPITAKYSATNCRFITTPHDL